MSATSNDFIIKKGVTCLICESHYDVTLLHKSYEFCPKCLKILVKIGKSVENIVNCDKKPQ